MIRRRRRLWLQGRPRGTAAVALRTVRVLLVSTYELGHQPVHVASPAATLRAGGHDVRAIDVSVEPWDCAHVDWAERVAFSVPMHTAMRMAVVLAASVRDRRPDLPVCLYGLYAGISREATTAALGERRGPGHRR